MWYVIGSFQVILKTGLTDLNFDGQRQRRALELRDCLLGRLARIDLVLRSLQEPRPTIEEVAVALERVSRLLHALHMCAIENKDLSHRDLLSARLLGPIARFVQADAADDAADDDADNQLMPVDDMVDTDPNDDIV